MTLKPSSVRTYGSTTMFQVIPNNATHSSAAMSLKELVSIPTSSTARRSVVDINLHPSSADMESLGEWKDVNYPIVVALSNKVTQIIVLLAMEPSNSMIGRDWRISQCFNLDQKDELIASIEAVSSDNIIRLVTTKELVWLDTRFPGRRPLLAYKHGRQYDRTLSTQTITMQGRWRSRLGDVLTQGAMEGRCRCTRRPIRSLRSDPGPLGAHDKSVVNLRETYKGEFILNRKRVVNELRNLQVIFEDHFAAEAADVQNTRTGVADIVERMPSFWQESAEPAEHMLTANSYDIAFRTGDEPAQSSRADFFTQSPITSSSGYRALSQGLVPTTSIARDAKWHYGLANTFRALGIEAETDVSLLDSQFRRYDLKHHFERTNAAIQKEREARQKLIVDLRLGSDVFSAQTFAPKPMSTTPFETMSRATQALTLGGEPPLSNMATLNLFSVTRAKRVPKKITLLLV
ncbi:60S ribosomal protein [Salix suchowensis]|nr:60S ribosomal protein [Salix suchowensis]